jgi:hypothetical protein
MAFVRSYVGVTPFAVQEDLADIVDMAIEELGSGSVTNCLASVVRVLGPVRQHCHMP